MPRNAGWLFIPNNRVLAIDESAINIDLGAAVTGYPKANLTDYHHHLTARFTPNGSSVLLLRFDLGAPPGGSADENYLVNAAGLVNHNFDGATISYYYGSTTTFADAIQVSGSEAELAVSDHAYSLLPFQGVPNPAGGEMAIRYWWLRVEGAPATCEIGNVVLGKAINLGPALKPQEYASVPWKDPVNTLGGDQVMTGPTEPIDTKVVTFADPGYTGRANVWDREMHASQSYPTETTVWRSWRHLLESNVGGTGSTAVGPAGGQIPILYREQMNLGMSSAGRPAFYGTCRPRLRRLEAEAASVIVMTITDWNPKGPDLAPPDITHFYISGAATVTGSVAQLIAGP